MPYSSRARGGDGQDFAHSRPSRTDCDRIIIQNRGCKLASIEQARAAYRFGVFELDCRSGELRKLGIKLKLQDQPLQLLLLLLEHAGEVVSRDEIQKRLWPKDTY